MMIEKHEKTLNFRYSIVSPVRNEEAILNQTMWSVVKQTIKPQKWILINDNSKDRTGEILDTFASKFSWIKIIHMKEEVHSYYKGVQSKLGLAFESININENDFIGKLDADIELNTTYFENLIRKLINNPKLGIVGGTLFHLKNGKRIKEKNPEDHVRGGLKFYRVQCWKDIGGMPLILGYDTIDEIKAEMCGWSTKSFSNIEALHHRPTGKEWGNIGIYIFKGKLAYLIGYHPLFLIAKSIKDMFSPPYIVGGITELLSFAKCYLNKTERNIKNKNFIEFLRKKQIKRLFSFKV